MFESKKLRTNTSLIEIMQPVIALLLFAISWSLFGITAGLITMAFIFCLYALLSLSFAIRTGNGWFYVTMVYQFTVVIFTLIAPKVGKYAVKESAFKPLILILFLELAVLIYIIATKRLRWKGREVMELAAMHVDDTSNGYTSRPRPLGNIEYSPQELIGFSNYLKKKLIAYPFKETTRTVLVPISTGDEYKIVLTSISDYTQYSWVAFDKEGSVTAHISKKDYLKYKEALSFDELCESLGELFIQFLEYYRRGEEIRIMGEIEKIKTGLYT